MSDSKTITKFLITGGSGFIGTNLIDSLIKKSFQVINLDKKEPVLSSHKSLWRNIDILDFKSFENAINEFEPEIIIHLAAVTDLDGKTLEYYNANIGGTKNLIDISHKISSLRKIIFTSSMYVCRPGYIPDNYNDYMPHTLYGKSKVQGELLAKDISHSNYQWVIVRPTSIWGPWFNIPYIDFFEVIYKGKYFDFGKSCTKTFGYIDNTISQIIKIAFSDAVHSKTFYLGDFPPIQISEWANEISHEMGKGCIKKVPFILMKVMAFLGDVLSRFYIKFPITSFRLSNITTNNILPLDDLYKITGESITSRKQGVKNTLKWLREHEGFKINTNYLF